MSQNTDFDPALHVERKSDNGGTSKPAGRGDSGDSGTSKPAGRLEGDESTPEKKEEKEP